MSSPDDGSTADSLSARDAFLAVSEFVRRRAARAGDDPMTLVSDTDIEADGQPSDPAARGDWLAAVERVRWGKVLPRE